MQSWTHCTWYPSGPFGDLAGLDLLFDNPFALLEEEIPISNLSAMWFQVYNYMRPEPGAVKDEPVDVD